MGPNSTRSSRSEVQVTSMVGKLRNGTTLNTFGRCFIAQAHDIFNKIPEDIKQRGVKKGWIKVIKEGQRFLRGEEKQNDGTKKETNKTKHTKSEIHREGFTALFVTLMTVGGSGLPGKKV